ncbi:Putative aspartic protease [Glycine soja]|nr:Putative aspartic protease [Glycine soja]
MHRPGSFYQVPKKSYASNGPFTRVTSNNGDYLMKLTLGTPPVDVYGLVDTGSDLVWEQCTPCQGCYKQKNPMFDPMIDSVTPATYLPQKFYDRLVEELKVQINLPPIHDDPDLGTQFCYRSETNLEGPILTAHFEGADVQLMPIQTFIPPKDGVFCFAMAGTTDGEYIFGNFAQSNVLIGFDLDRRTVSYKATDCTNR